GLDQHVEALLKSHDDAGSFLDAPIGEQMSEAAGQTEVAEPSLAAQAENLTETQGELPPAAESGLDLLAPSAKPGSLRRLLRYRGRTNKVVAESASAIRCQALTRPFTIHVS